MKENEISFNDLKIELFKFLRFNLPKEKARVISLERYKFLINEFLHNIWNEE